MATALHPGSPFDTSFIRKAIFAHLYQSQRSVVIGRSADRINLVGRSAVGGSLGVLLFWFCCSGSVMLVLCPVVLVLLFVSLL